AKSPLPLDGRDDDGACLGRGATVQRLARGATLRPIAFADPAADERLVGFHDPDRAEAAGVVLLHQIGADLLEHPPRGLVVAADLALQVLRGDAAARTGDEVERIEPIGERSRRLREDRSGRRMNVQAAGGACPGLATLLRGVPLEAPLLLAT